MRCLILIVLLMALCPPGSLAKNKKTMKKILTELRLLKADQDEIKTDTKRMASIAEKLENIGGMIGPMQVTVEELIDTGLEHVRNAIREMSEGEFCFCFLFFSLIKIIII